MKNYILNLLLFTLQLTHTAQSRIVLTGRQFRTATIRQLFHNITVPNTTIRSASKIAPLIKDGKISIEKKAFDSEAAVCKIKSDTEKINKAVVVLPSVNSIQNSSKLLTKRKELENLTKMAHEINYRIQSREVLEVLNEAIDQLFDECEKITSIESMHSISINCIVNARIRAEGILEEIKKNNEPQEEQVIALRKIIAKANSQIIQPAISRADIKSIGEDLYFATTTIHNPFNAIEFRCNIASKNIDEIEKELKNTKEYLTAFREIEKKYALKYENKAAVLQKTSWWKFPFVAIYSLFFDRTK